jgi:hypothetical protein
MISSGGLNATKVGSMWVIDPKELERIGRWVVLVKRARLQAVKADSTLVFIENPEKDRCDHSGQ